MSSGSSASLRDLYTNPPSSWAFNPVSDNNNNNGFSNVASRSKLPEPATPWTSARPRPNSIYELSPGLNFDPSGPNAIHLLKTFAASAILTYAGVALEMPFEVAKRLLQVQYVPRDAKAVEYIEWEEEEDHHENEESSSENEEYFADENTDTPRIRSTRPTRPTDERGYVIRQNISDETTRADYVIPVGSADGVWAMIKQITRWKPEGWFSLWKGLATTSVLRLIEASIKPIIHSILSSFLSSLYRIPNSSIFSHNHQIILPVLSNVLTGVFLSPLDLICTRLIVQTSVTRFKRYTGPFDAFSQIIRDEGGLRGIYFHPQLLYPTIFDSALTALVEALSPLLVARLFGPNVSEDSHPALWAFAQLIGSCTGALLILPIQTARRRLQVQTRIGGGGGGGGGGGAAAAAATTTTTLHTCIEIRPRPYFGIIDTIYSILKEERSDLPLKPTLRTTTRHSMQKRERERRMSKSKKGKMREGATSTEDAEDFRLENNSNEVKSWLRNTGLGQLYRGLGLNLTGSVLIFLLALFAGTDTDDGWTEL